MFQKFAKLAWVCFRDACEKGSLKIVARIGRPLCVPHRFFTKYTVKDADKS